MKTCLTALTVLAMPFVGSAVQVQGDAGRVSFTLDPNSGAYSLEYKPFGWKLAGRPVGPCGLSRSTNRIMISHRIGSFRLCDFTRYDGLRFRVMLSESTPLVEFELTYPGPVNGNGLVFPNFDSAPAGLRAFSYQDRTFSPPTFGLSQTCTPWLFFDQAANSMIVSPASNFMIETMQGGPSIGCGLNSAVTQIKPGFRQEAVVVFGQGIGNCWDTWGTALRKLYGRPQANQTGPMLTRFGYWTDNGADYYYNYEPGLGYAGTLLELRKRYDDEGIPLGYLQLDSWWYDKSIDDPAGHPGGRTKNATLPAGAWNRYGGLMEYRADKDLFPDGLKAFHDRLGLPLAVHNRWMDRKSPYCQQFKVSGVAVIDPKWWDQTADYLSSSGVVCYEQDWLDRIYQNSPEMASEPGVGDAFTDGMARACSGRNMDMQYCMPSPRFILQGLLYPNLTTIRTSDDRFEPSRWNHFLFVSQLAQEVGIWPWCDVFKSGETGNMIVSVLSAGPVGTGDRIGQEDKGNILKAARPDGVLVKPDRSLLPCDQSYLEPKAPLLASTYTDHAGLRTMYLFGFPRGEDRQLSFRLGAIAPGVKRWYVYRFATDSGSFADPGDEVHEAIDPSGYTYLMAAPQTASGMVLLGDLGKFVPTGKQRMSEITETPSGLSFRVLFAKGEKSVRISGISPRAPRVESGGTLASYDPASGRFAVEVRSNGKAGIKVGLST